MAEDLLFGLAGIIVLGVAAQWLAWRMRLPSILLLLIFGFLAGPVTGFIDPDELIGGLLFPLVSISVAVILFEGGLSLKISELRKTGSVVHRLISVGALTTWVFGTLASRYVLGLDLPLSVLFGAILVVSGPTVIVPLLRHVRPIGPVASVLRWEGMLIDPIGALLAVLVYEAILAGRFEEMGAVALLGIIKTVLIGGAVGALGAFFMVIFLRRYWIPDFLQNPVTLMMVVIAFTVSNIFQTESGLLAVTVMGIVLANQKIVAVRHIIEFKENLRVLLISGLFILLAARLSISDLEYFLRLESLVFLVILVLLIRPAAVFLSTPGTGLKLKEKVFLSSVYPRGIVAAAVASVFALRLIEAGVPQAQQLVPLTFMVIIGTVAVHGLSASAIARRLEVSQPNPQGVLIVGAHPWAVSIARALKQEGFDVLVTDTNWAHTSRARMSGLPVYYGSILSETILQELELDGIGRIMALTPNDGVNSLAALHFVEVFGRSEVYQLAAQAEEKVPGETVSKHLRGRFLFGPELDYYALARRFIKGAVIKKTNLTEEFDFEAFKKMYGEGAEGAAGEGGVVPLFLINEAGKLVIFTTDREITPKPGHTLLSLVDKVPEQEAKQTPEKNSDKDDAEK